MTVCLVACSGRKLGHGAPARDLYTGDTFVIARRYVELAYPGRWGILSALHGLVMPEQVVEPYELHIDDLTRRARNAWGLRTAEQVRTRWPTADVVLLAPKAYRNALIGLKATCPWDHVHNAGSGRQRRWLLDRIADLEVALREAGLARSRS